MRVIQTFTIVIRFFLKLYTLFLLEWKAMRKLLKKIHIMLHQSPQANVIMRILLLSEYKPYQKIIFQNFELTIKKKLFIHYS